MKVLLFPVFTALVSAVDIFFTATDPQYSAHYSVDTTLNTINPELHLQLELLNYDIRNWTTTEIGTDSAEGVFMGIGLGTQIYGTGDVIICNYTQMQRQLNNAAMNCFDYYFDPSGALIFNE